MTETRYRGPCFQCVFYRAPHTVPVIQEGECTARAPRSSEDKPTAAIWPTVHASDGCGDFQRART